MKHRPILTGIAVILFLLTAGSLYIWLTVPKSIETHIGQVFTQAGFENVVLPEPETRMGQIRYKDIQLDPNGFSNIKSLSLHYSLLSAAFGNTLDSIKVSGLELTGELQQNNRISLAGWSGKTDAITLQWPIAARTLSFEDSRISLLSEEWGGIALSGEAQLRPSGQNIEFKSRIEGRQRQLSANMQIEGQITQEGFWESRIELEQGKFEVDQIRATRVAGLINISGQGKQASQLIGELQAGGLNILGLPWQNVAITLDGKPNTLRAIISAKSAGTEGLELGITIPDLNNPTRLTGQIHAQNLGIVFDYLNNQNRLPMPREHLSSLDQIASIDMRFRNQNDFIFNIKKEEQNIDLKGKITKTDLKTHSAEFLSLPLPLEEILNHKNARGSAILKGNISREDEKLSGEVLLTLKEASLGKLPLPITIAEGEIKLDDFTTLSGPVTKKKECRITGFKSEATCHVDLQIKNAAPTFSNLNIKGPGFEIYAPQSTNKEQKSLFTIKAVELKPLLDLFNNKNWGGAGLFTGTMALHEKEGALHMNSLYLQSKGVGILKLKDSKLFDLMDMEELEKETMKLALENFHYDLLEIKAEGRFPDQVKISVFGKGKNPYLMQGRQFSIDFEVTPDFTQLATMLFEKPAGL